MQAGQGPLNTPSFSNLNPNGVIDIPTSAYVTIDASGPDVLLTAQLTGACYLPVLRCLPCLASYNLLQDPFRNLSIHLRDMYSLGRE